MIRTLRPGLKLLLLIHVLSFLSCHKNLKISSKNTPNYESDYSRYFNIDTTTNFEANAVLCNIYGDYKTAIVFTAKNQTHVNSSVNLSDNEVSQLKAHLNAISLDSVSTNGTKANALNVLNLLSPVNLDAVFETVSKEDARSTIVNSSKDFHFLLINEAHYSSQNRSFTHTLLKPLWENGYRYLALEALGYEDPDLAERGSPVKKSGYYLKDPVFSSLIREALRIGYVLIPYETKNNLAGTARDRDQAFNIYSNTLKKDSTGKVLVHAGYSHIAEAGGSEYLPMGLQLKTLAQQDILTVDQVNMVDEKNHSFYEYVENRYKFDKPIVLFDKYKRAIIDPVNRQAIDIQVYHPPTRYKHNRPLWLLERGNFKFAKIPSELKRFKGCLLQIMRLDAVEEEIPIDQIVIDETTRLVLPPDTYQFRLVNPNGDLIGTGDLDIR